MRKTNTRGEGGGREGCTHLHEEDEHKRRGGREGGCTHLHQEHEQKGEGEAGRVALTCIRNTNKRGEGGGRGDVAHLHEEHEDGAREAQHLGRQHLSIVQLRLQHLRLRTHVRQLGLQQCQAVPPCAVRLTPANVTFASSVKLTAIVVFSIMLGTPLGGFCVGTPAAHR